MVSRHGIHRAAPQISSQRPQRHHRHSVDVRARFGELGIVIITASLNDFQTQTFHHRPNPGDGFIGKHQRGHRLGYTAIGSDDDSFVPFVIHDRIRHIRSGRATCLVKKVRGALDDTSFIQKPDRGIIQIKKGTLEFIIRFLGPPRSDVDVHLAIGHGIFGVRGLWLVFKLDNGIIIDRIPQTWSLRTTFLLDDEGLEVQRVLVTQDEFIARSIPIFCQVETDGGQRKLSDRVGSKSIQDVLDGGRLGHMRKHRAFVGHLAQRVHYQKCQACFL